MKVITNKQTGETIEIPPPTKNMKTDEFSIYLDAAAKWLAEFCGIVVYPPKSSSRNRSSNHGSTRKGARGRAAHPTNRSHHTPPDIFQTGEMLARSGYFQDAKDAAQTFVKILAARELGIGDIAGMTGIYIVKGKVSLSANLMAALVKRSGRYNYRVTQVWMTRAARSSFSSRAQPIGVSAFAEDGRAQGGGLVRAATTGRSFRGICISRARCLTASSGSAPDVSMTSDLHAGRVGRGGGRGERRGY
jgi:hypothetical protein